MWSVVPFLTQDKPVRYAALLYAILSGSITTYSSVELIKNKRIYAALDKSEVDDFLHQLAVQQYTQQQNHTQQGVTDPELRNAPSYNELQDSGYSSGNSEHTELPDPELVTDVEDALADELTDSQIIKNILGFKGRNYQQGKDLLDAIKKLIKETDKDERN
jgi:hypothetical protein